MDSKIAFIEEWSGNEYCFAELCRRHGVSRPAGYKWVERYVVEGWAGLEERSRAPQERPGGIGEAMRRAGGGRSSDEAPELGTEEAEGVAGGRAVRRGRGQGPGAEHDRGAAGAGGTARPAASPAGLCQPVAGNDLWPADYKGWFRTGDGRRCEPLTITDNASRKLLRLSAMERIDQVRARGDRERVP